MDILEKHYPNKDHVFVFDNASTHQKRTDGALSAHRMPKCTSTAENNWGVEANICWDDYAFNRNLEACFETHRIPVGGTIVFQERGPQLYDLIQTFKMAEKGLTTDMNWTFMQEVWLEKLIKAAEMQGAKISNK